MADPVYGMLGLAQRAGKVLSGAVQVEGGFRNPRASLLVLAGDASEETVKQYTRAAAVKGIPVISYGKKEDLGRALGKGVRTAALLCDKGFAKAIITKIEKKQRMDTQE